MKELVVISGKGGTGKTSLTASFAALAERPVVADCDVDAADLHLVASPQIERREVFRSGYEARIIPERCDACGACARLCRFDAIRRAGRDDGTPVYAIDPFACEGCGLCVRYCPRFAIDLEERECGEWYISRTRWGPLVHARLQPASENSGKLVSTVREAARQTAAETGRELVLIDGAPGTGCPVIASLTGAALALIVTEPTVSGVHDLERIAQVTAHFRVPTCVCINKWDLNPALATEIESFAREHGITFAGRVRYDRAITAAQRAAQALVEYSADGASGDVRAVWQTVYGCLRAVTPPAPGAPSPLTFSPNPPRSPA